MHQNAEIREIYFSVSVQIHLGRKIISLELIEKNGSVNQIDPAVAVQIRSIRAFRTGKVSLKERRISVFVRGA